MLVAARENELAHWEKRIEGNRQDIQEREEKLRTLRQQFEDLKNKEVMLILRRCLSFEYCGR